MDLKMMRRLSSRSTRTDPRNYSLSSGAAGGGGGEKRSGLNMNMVGSMGFLVACLMALSLLITFGVVFRDQPSHQMPVPDVSQSQTPAFKKSLSSQVLVMIYPIQWMHLRTNCSVACLLLGLTKDHV